MNEDDMRILNTLVIGGALLVAVVVLILAQ